MYSTWYDLNMTYYTGKVYGFFPLAGNRKCLSLWYSFVIWILIISIGISFNVKTHEYVKYIPSEQKVLKNIIRIEVFIIFITSVLNIVLSAQRSKRFFQLLNSFYRFDEFTLQIQCPPNNKTQTFYLLYVSCVGIYHLSFMLYFSLPKFDIKIKSVLKLCLWTMISLSTMINVTQYVTCIRMLRDRYLLANFVFKNSIGGSKTVIKYPKEIDNLFIKLRHLTEEIKTHYANFTILIIVESVLLLVSSLTKLTINYTNSFETEFSYNKLLLTFNILKFIFIFFIVKEAHNTIQEANKTVLIAHDALHITSDSLVIKEFEILIMNFWSHPVVFDVHDIFYLDYKLLQSIIASVVTYVVFLVQIQLAIFNQT